jgi:hypothetical protein
MATLDRRQFLEDRTALTGLGLRKPGIQRGGIALTVQQVTPPLHLTALDPSHRLLLGPCSIPPSKNAALGRQRPPGSALQAGVLGSIGVSVLFWVFGGIVSSW